MTDRDDLPNLLGTDRMIRRAYERATAFSPERKAAVKRWHDLEEKVARERKEKRHD